MGILGPALPIANSSMPVDQLDSTWLPELESWGKSLISPGRRATAASS